MATIVYLDAEDEITSAAARIRAAADSRVGLVLPFGSRVATSRINFRLLAREAMSHGRRLDIVAPDASARALAASAGLPVFALGGRVRGGARHRGRREGRAAGGSRAAAGSPAVRPWPAERPRPPPPTPVAPRRSPAGGADRRRQRPELGRRRRAAASSARPRAAARPPPLPAPTDLPTPTCTTRPAPSALPRPLARRAAGRPGAPAGPPSGAIVGTLLVLVVVVGAVGVGAYLLLPSASITVTPRIEDLGPVTFKVHADPTATSVDEAAGVVPAVTLTVPVETQSDFPATGKRVERHPAKGGRQVDELRPDVALHASPRGPSSRPRAGPPSRPTRRCSCRSRSCRAAAPRPASTASRARWR